MSTKQENEDKGKVTLAYFESINSLVSDFIEGQNDKESERKVIIDNLFDLQKKAGLTKLEELKARISDALPGEQQRLKRKLRLLKSDALTNFILNEQERIEAELQSHYLHHKFASLSVYAVTPAEMWEHYKVLKPGDIPAVYEYQLKREIHAFLEQKLIELETEVDAPASLQTNVLVEATDNINVNDLTQDVHTFNASTLPEAGNDDNKISDRASYKMDRSFRELFSKREEADEILTLLRERELIDENHHWVGDTIFKSELAAMARVLGAKDYLRQCSSGELARACNTYFGVEIDESIYRREASKKNNKYYRELIPNRSKV